MKIFYILWIFIIANGKAVAQNIFFPDPIFKDKLINTKCVDKTGDGIGDDDVDVDNNGHISFEEASQVSWLTLENQGIYSVESIEFFVNLEHLFLSYNHIENLEISSMVYLKVISCSNNDIARVSLDSLPVLTDLFLNSNKITEIHLESIPHLSRLELDDNKIEVFDITAYPQLQIFSCTSNLLSNLTLGEHPEIKTLYIDDNKLDTIYLTNLQKLMNFSCGSRSLTCLKLFSLPNLQTLTCFQSKLEELDLEEAPNLTWVQALDNGLKVVKANGLSKLELFSLVLNDLQYLFLNTGHIIADIHLYDNPDLKYICCGENEVARMLDVLYSAEIYSCEVNSYCSFSSFGQTNVLNGTALYANSPLECDPNSISVDNMRFQVEDSIGNLNYFISNKSGNFQIPFEKGNYIITPIVAYPNYFNITPMIYSLNFSSTFDTITQNFCITPKEPFLNINITIIPLSPPARPGFDAAYKIILENKGNLLENGTLHFTYDENIFDYVNASISPDAVNSGKISWDYTDLLPFEKREITVTLNLNNPTENPPVNAGDITYLYANILDKIFTLENTIVGSYDPNDKTSLQGNYFHPDSVGKFVDFLIRFENTGNYAAENIVVKDIIDDKVFDVSSLQITDASHEIYTRIVGNKVEFIFEDIQLPFDDEHNDGYIAFKIKTKSSLMLGDSLKNLADIYFDYNFPIRTNETHTTIAIPSKTKDEIIDVLIYPNPVRDILFLDGDGHWKKAEIYDLAGRLIRTTYPEGKTIDVSVMQNGSYLLKLQSADKTGWVKFVKM